MVRAKKKSKNAKTTFEICPYCDNEVEIPADLSKLHPCPICGIKIAACSICDKLPHCKGCVNCKLTPIMEGAYHLNDKFAD